jgi:hypothetical protein
MVLEKLGIVLVEMTRFDEAKASFVAALESDPGKPSLRHKLEQVNTLLGTSASER